MKVHSSKNKVSLDQIQTAIESSNTLADINDIALDKEYVEKNRHDWCWLDYKNIPEVSGWYMVNREKSALEIVAVDDAVKLQWHERVFIYESAIEAAKKQTPLALYIGYEDSDERLSALYLCGPDYLAWVTQKRST